MSCGRTEKIMKNMRNFKKTVAILALLLALSLLASCTESYIDTVSPRDLLQVGLSAVDGFGDARFEDEDFILEITSDTLDCLMDFQVVTAKDAKNINEIGIFRAKDGKASELKPYIDAYVEGMQKTYRAMDYFPEEVEKIDNATVKVFGNYVVYTFLGEVNTDAFYSAVESAVKK